MGRSARELAQQALHDIQGDGPNTVAIHVTEMATVGVQPVQDSPTLKPKKRKDNRVKSEPAAKSELVLDCLQA